MRILFFAHLKDVTGQAEIEWKMTEALDDQALWQKLMTAYPDLAPFRSTVRLARNCEYAGPDTVFTDADEVALIPPVSGG
jgi:MoaE-MoaD fusion protein